MDAKRAKDGDWEEVQPLGKRELDRILAGRINRRDRIYLYKVLDECGLCIFEK
jgi:hypothetical protein